MNNQNNDLNKQPQTLGQIASMPLNDTVSNEMDDFVEPKKSHFGIIFFILLLLLIAGGVAYYYFIVDNPKTIFKTAINDVLDKINFEESKKNGVIDYDLNLNITSKETDMKEMLDIINQFKLSGTIGVNDNNHSLLGTVNYKNKKLLDYNIVIDDSDTPAIYAKLDDLYNKIIKIDLDETDFTEHDTNIKDYKQLMSSYKTVINSSLDNANYQKEYLKLNDEIVKKISINIDESFLTNIYNKLLQDSAFITSYANINGMTYEEVSDLLNKDITDAKGNEETIDIYLSVLKNEFLKFEYNSAEDNLTVTKDNDKYNFDLSESYTSIYQGYIKMTEVNNKNNLTISLLIIEEKLNIEANIEYVYDENKQIPSLDTSDTINLDDLNEEETDKIVEKLTENEAFIMLMEDFQKIAPADDESLELASDV